VALRRYTHNELNQALSEVYYGFAGALSALGHRDAKIMAWSAYYYGLNIAFLGRFLFWYASLGISKEVWAEVMLMNKFERVDITSGKALLNK